ncbi:MAG: BppU family phage baseplate upper protein [Clostridium sp.]|uniref:BppU family phage baseplate upper protein n=1 Tax=Clostridium sp. TaxID=1506 RepID=UPI003D6CFF4A
MEIPQNPYETNLAQSANSTFIFKVILTKNKIPLDLTGLKLSLTIFKADVNLILDLKNIKVTDTLNGKVTITLPTKEIALINTYKAQISINSKNTKQINFPQFTFKSIIDNFKLPYAHDFKFSDRDTNINITPPSIKDVSKNTTTGLPLDICNLPNNYDLKHNSLLEGSLPQYVINGTSKTQAKVADISTNDTIQFVFVTDLHADDYLNYYYQIQNHLKAVIDIQKYGILDFIVIGGDFHSGVYPDKENPKSKLSDLTKILNNSKVPVLVLHGNHDDNSYYVTPPINPVISNIITKSEWFNRMIRPFMNGEIHDTSDKMSLYYYKDFYYKKIRVICLDSSDYPIIINSDGTMKWHGQNFYGFGSRQVQWLQTEALNTLDRTDWSVIILSHMATRNTNLMFNKYDPYNGNLIEGLLKAFMNGSDFTGSTSGDYGISINASFKSQGARKILSYVYGHTHTDQNNKPVDLGWNFINTSCCYSSGIEVRTKNTDKEDLWDAIVVDKITGAINCFRYGYGNDRQIL